MIDIKSQIIKPALDLEDLKVVASAEGWKLTDLRSLGFFLRRNFKYRRKITITELSGNNLSDYQVRIDLDATNFNFSHFLNEGNDLRFTDADGNLLSYFVEKMDITNKQATIWVKIPSIPANGTVDIYMYYGNPEIPSASNGIDTGIFYDNFTKPILHSYGRHHPTYDIICPRAVIANNKLFVLWYADSVNRIACLDLRTFQWSSTVELTLTVGGDNHLIGSIFVDEDGYIHVFDDCHGKNTDGIRHHKSNSPYDITTLTDKGRVVSSTSNAGPSYPNPVRHGVKIFLFYRWSELLDTLSECGWWCYIKSTDGGETWSPENKLIDFTPQDPDSGIYVGKCFYDGRYAHIAFCKWIEGNKGKLRNIYYFKFDLETEKAYAIDGAELTLPLSMTDADNYCLVTDNGGNDVEIPKCIGIDENGYPHIIWRDWSTAGDGAYKHSYWDGSKWVTIDIGIKARFLHSAGFDGIVHSFDNIEAWLQNDVDCSISYCKFNGSSWSEVLRFVAGQCLECPQVIENWNENFKIIFSEFVDNFTDDIRAVIIPHQKEFIGLFDTKGYWKYDGYTVEKDYGTAPGNLAVAQHYTLPDKFIIEGRMILGDNESGVTVFTSANDFYTCECDPANDLMHIYYYDGTRWYKRAETSVAYAQGDAIDFEVVYDGTNLIFRDLTNNVSLSLAETISNRKPGVHVSAGFATSTKYEWIRARKYVEPEPSVSIGGEET